jgi:hypothetical protein
MSKQTAPRPHGVPESFYTARRVRAWSNTDRNFHPQDLQQLWRKHDIAIYAPFALFDSDNHSFAIDICDFQADSFRDAQPGRVAGGQNRAMLDVPYTTQKLKNFFWTGDNWQLLGFLGGWNDLRQTPILMKRDFVKETKSCNSQVDRAWSELPLGWLGGSGRNESPQGPAVPVTD